MEGSGITDLSLKGRILTPGTFTAHVNGAPAKIRFSRDVILRAYEKLKASVAKGLVEMRLAHPHLAALTIPFGKVTGVRIDSAKGDVWLSASEPEPEIASLFDDKARAALQTLGLSIRAPIQFDAAPKGADYDYDARDFDIEAVDVVDQGAFDGSNIAPTLPEGLAAKLAARAVHRNVATQHAGTVVQLAAQATTEEHTTTMEITVEQVPEEVRNSLKPEQLEAYVTAFNAALGSGLDLAKAHEAAMKATQVGTTGGLPAASGDETMPKPEPELAARFAQLEAQHADTTKKLEETNKLLEAAKATAAERDELKQKLEAASAEKSTIEARVAKLEAAKADLEAREATRAVEADVDSVIRDGVAPSMRPSLLEARKAMGAEGFKKLAATMPRTVPVGEKGRTGTHAGTGTDELSAARASVKEIGVDNVLSSGVHMRDPHIALVLRNEYGTHPQVARISARLASIAAKAQGGA